MIKTIKLDVTDETYRQFRFLDKRCRGYVRSITQRVIEIIDNYHINEEDQLIEELEEQQEDEYQ